MTYIFGKLFTLSKRIYVIAFAEVSSPMIFQGGGLSKVFGPILHAQLIMNFYSPTHKIRIETTLFFFATL